MTYHPRFARAADNIEQQGAGAIAASGRTLPLARAVSFLAGRLAAWIKTAADYYAAAILYEQLSRLSDAELRRRGLSRTSLARDVSAACDRPARPD